MVGRVGMILHRIRQHVVEVRRVAADEDAEERGNGHGCPHVPGRLGGAFPGLGAAVVLAEPDEIGNLQAGVQERTGGGQHQQKADPELVLLEAGRDDHGFADKAAEEREGRDGQAADQGEDKGPRHFSVEPAQFGELALAGHVQHRAAAHEEEALVENVGEGVGAGAVDGHLGAEPHAGHHVADLADDVVGQQPAGSRSPARHRQRRRGP